MTDPEIDDRLARAGRGQEALDPALLARASAAVTADLHPVKPLPPVWLLVAGLLTIFAAVAVAGAARLGMYGLHALTSAGAVLILSDVAAVAVLAAYASVAAMTPGSRTIVGAPLLVLCGILALLAVLGGVLHDYGATRFVPAGIVCLEAGLLHALPAGLVSWVVLRRGFAVDAVAAGIAAGTLAGLAGIGMLELHCANLEAPHQMVWHVAVLPVSAAVGGLIAWMTARR